jgi:steroid 5-alpha reductase family enzyme
VYRVTRDGEDRRFRGVREQPLKLGVYFFVSAVWVVVTSLPMVLVNAQAAAQQAATLQARGALGSLMTAAGVVAFAAGLALECIADWQKLRFRAKRENEDKFITHGVWAWSRHPNYAGEIALWWGVFLFAAASLSAPQACAAAASPALVTLLLTKVSGVPLLERSGLKRWGGDAEYKAYRARTPCLWPDPMSVLGLKPSM